MSAPPPPYSSATGKPWMPNFAHFFHPSQENSSFRSRSITLSFSSSRANLMTDFCRVSSSSLQEKSTASPRRLGLNRCAELDGVNFYSRRTLFAQYLFALNVIGYNVSVLNWGWQVNLGG